MLLRYPSVNDISRSIVSGARSPMETTYRVSAYDIGETAQRARVLSEGPQYIVFAIPLHRP